MTAAAAAARSGGQQGQWALSGAIETSNGYREVIRIHIVGVGPRCGTTLLAECMHSCFWLDSPNEHESSLFASVGRLGDDAVYLTKRPRDVMVVDPMIRANQNLWILCMVRDPRDMIVSKHGKDPNKYWASLRYWKTYVPYMRKLTRHERFIMIRYEDLVQEPDRVQLAISARMPFLKSKARFSEFEAQASPSSHALLALNGLRRIDSSSIGRWRDHLPRIKSQLEIHGEISEDLIEFGYEKDGSWAHALDAVEQVTYQSHWPEHFRYFELIRKRRGKYIKALAHLVRRIVQPRGLS